MSNPWDLDIKPGSKIAFQCGDEIREATVTSWKYHTPGPTAVWPELTRWQRFLRAINPWRKPLKPTWEHNPPTMTLTTEPMWMTRTRDLLKDLEA